LINLHSTEEKRIIGLMSGTSLDGLDIACVVFPNEAKNPRFTLEHAETVPLPQDLLLELETIEGLSARLVFQLNQKLGLFYAKSVTSFLDKYSIPFGDVDAIASHGQTVFHQPGQGFTVQLGCGATLAYHTGIPVINNFRSLDVAAGGQGAPLVPLGDTMLFGNEAASFLNIGGFTNLSFCDNGTHKAFDVSPGNLPLNRYAQLLGKAYDENGLIAAASTPNSALLAKLNRLPFYAVSGPKSLGSEWLHDVFYPCIPLDIAPEIALATLTEHIAMQLAAVLKYNALPSVMVTGGGALNQHLMERLKAHYSGKVVIPSNDWVHFKEAIIFAFLGYRFLKREFNCLASVTGASKNVCGGTLHYPE
jgi:anhydro-N-acetylmuramic acid kinase